MQTRQTAHAGPRPHPHPLELELANIELAHQRYLEALGGNDPTPPTEAEQVYPDPLPDDALPLHANDRDADCVELLGYAGAIIFGLTVAAAVIHYGAKWIGGAL